MLESLYKIYAFLFARNLFVSLNKLLFYLSLRGLGYYNYYNEFLTGEKYFKFHVFQNKGRKVIFDVGANVGDYSKKIAENKQALIYAFEASPLNFIKLKERVSQLDNIIPLNIAISDKAATTIIYDYKGDNGSSHASVYKEVFTEYLKKETVEHQVNTKNLDEFATENKIEFIDLLKIDVEGHELKVLNGAKNLIENKKIKMIQFEFTQLNSLSRIFFRDLYLLLDNNYKIYRLLPTGLLLIEKYSPTDHEIFGYSNYVAISR